MERVSDSVINAVAKVLKDQFNIEMSVDNNGYHFRDLKTKKRYKGERQLIHFPDVSCKVTDRIYKTDTGREIRCIEGAYSSRSGDMTVMVVENGKIWRIYADNYPRDNGLRTIETPIDCPHVVLNYQGNRKNYISLYDNSLFKNDNPEYVEMITETPDIYKERNCDIPLARFYIYGTPVVFVSTDGVLLNYDVKEDGGPIIKESDSFDGNTLRDLIKTRVIYTYEHRDWLDLDALKKKVDFLVGRVGEYEEYIKTHQADFLGRIDELSEVRETRKNAIVSAAVDAITEANNAYREDCDKIGDNKRAFSKTFPNKK